MDVMPPRGALRPATMQKVRTLCAGVRHARSTSWRLPQHVFVGYPQFTLGLMPAPTNPVGLVPRSGADPPMPYTVPVSFDRFVDNISLTGDHQETANVRKDDIVATLKDHFTIVDAFATGSIPKDTALKSKADLDVMVVLHWERHIKGKTCEQVLQDVRDVLAEYRTNVRKNGQAVTLYYKTWPNVDIVPVSVTYNADDATSVNHYNVPDMNTGKWLWSRPRRHAAAINERAVACGVTFKPLVRIIKQWNAEHSTLMESYHIEALALRICTAPLSAYSWDVFNFFDEAVKLVAAPLEYDGGYADDYLDDYDARFEVLKRLRTARDRARDAWYLTYNGRDQHENAIEIWRQIFGSRFPAYG